MNYKNEPNDTPSYSAHSPHQSNSESNPITPDHYAMPISPIEYIERNGLTFSEGNVVKYVSRHRMKNGAEDIRKAIKYCKLILKYEYNETENPS